MTATALVGSLDHITPARLPADAIAFADTSVVAQPASVVPAVCTVSVLALVPMVVGHVSGAGTVDPVADPISYYAFVPWGYQAVGAGALLLAVCGIVLAHRLTRQSQPRAQVGAVMMLSFAAAMLLVGIFPTDPPGIAHSSLAAGLHRLGAAWAFAVLPVLGLTVMRAIGTGPTSRLLVRMSAITATLVGVFFAVHVPVAMNGGRIPAFGLVERAGFALMVVYLIALAVTLRNTPTGVPNAPAPALAAAAATG